MTLLDLYLVNYGWSKDAWIDIHFKDEVAFSSNLVSASEAIKKFGDRSVCYFVDDLVVLR
jgi:hypothetical protein